MRRFRVNCRVSLINVSQDDLDILKDIFSSLDVPKYLSSVFIQLCNHEINRLDLVSCDSVEYYIGFENGD